MDNDWIKTKRGANISLEYDTEVEVMFKNGNISKARVQGNWFVFSPKDIRIDDHILGIVAFRVVK